MKSDGHTDGANRAVETLTTMMTLLAAMIGLLSTLIALTETPDLAYNGGPMAIALAILAGVMIIYAQLYREKWGTNLSCVNIFEVARRTVCKRLRGQQ